MIALHLAAPWALMLGVLVLAAGRLDVWGFLAWAAVMWFGAVVTYTWLRRVSPELLAERMKPPSDRDRATRRLMLLPLLGGLIVSGLDVRFGWSTVPLPVQIGGLVLVALGFALVGWVLLTNPFASSAVRIQQDRGQRVISSGPYAIVRHPMYLATLLICLGSGPALGSWWGGLVFLTLIPVFVRRTLLEDRMLNDELDGYRDYASRVRWRVVPHVF
jgi:protein-S-isoprenylcysteine O-methyltransferase Ste14